MYFFFYSKRYVISTSVCTDELSKINQTTFSVIWKFSFIELNFRNTRYWPSDLPIGKRKETIFVKSGKVRRRLYKYFYLLFSYWPILWLILFTLGSADKLCIRTEFSFSLFPLRTVCLMLLKLQYAVFLTFIDALNIVHSPNIFRTKYSLTF